MVPVVDLFEGLEVIGDDVVAYQSVRPIEQLQAFGYVFRPKEELLVGQDVYRSDAMDLGDRVEKTIGLDIKEKLQRGVLPCSLA